MYVLWKSIRVTKRIAVSHLVKSMRCTFWHRKYSAVNPAVADAQTDVMRQWTSGISGFVYCDTHIDLVKYPFVKCWLWHLWTMQLLSSNIVHIYIHIICGLISELCNIVLWAILLLCVYIILGKYRMWCLIHIPVPFSLYGAQHCACRCPVSQRRWTSGIPGLVYHDISAWLC